jgi:hypothetical protein
MNANEPIFWACGLEEDEAVSNALKIKLGLEYYNIPLYTHDARIKVLEANHKIQLDINEKALQYIAELEKALESSIKLNKAQAERQ